MTEHRDLDQVLEEYGVEKHPEADKFDSGTYDEPGKCICGQPLPPQKEWDSAGQQWQSVTCESCGRCYVDEDEYVMIYDEGCDDDPDDVTPGGSP